MAWTGPSGESPLHEHTGSPDLFVLNLDSSGTYQWHTFYGNIYGGETDVAEDPDAPTRGTLPSRCAGCGAPLLPDEVEWHDAYTAECVYCGTVSKAS